MSRIFADAALPPGLLVLDFLAEHFLLILGIVIGVAVLAAVLIRLLNKPKNE